jgi:tRNA dimethylallyltransferase
LIDGVPYKLFSILPLTEQISVADYLNLARAELDNLPPDTPAIFVGGTGFYINALINGISPMPNVSPENRRRAREQIARNPSQLCCAAVNGLDPQRAARALEVLLETGKPIEYWQSLPRTGGLATSNQQPTAILINPPRETINARIAARIPKMLSGGALREAENIIAKELPENRAIGSAQLCKYLRGEISESDAIENWTTKTQQYAKRQRTWFRTQFTPDIIIDNIPTENDINKIKEV